MPSKVVSSGNDTTIRSSPREANPDVGSNNSSSSGNNTNHNNSSSGSTSSRSGMDYFYDIIHTFLPGAAQGFTTILIGHPLDTAKIRMQAAGPNAQTSPWTTIYEMITREGAKSVYRGVVPPLLMEGTKRSLQFALYDTFRSCKKEDSEKRTPPRTVREQLRSRVVHTSAVIGGNPFLAGAVAGGLGTIIGCPMHVIKIQTQYQTREGTRNAWTCTKEIFRQDGFLGFYRGLKFNLLKDVCFAALYLGLFTVFRDYLRQPTVMEKSRFLSPNTTAFLSGAGASMMTWTLLYPLDTFKTLVQSKHTIDWKAMLHSPLRMYTGLSASLWKAGPVSGASMLAYDYTKRKLVARKEQRRLKKEEAIMMHP